MNPPLIGEVGLVADEHYDDVAAALGAHIVDPLRRLMEGARIYTIMIERFSIVFLQ